MNTRKMKNTKGITLVALIVTIIVLLILAGISLNLIMGEKGITQRAVNAGKVHNISGAKEKLELQIADYAGEYYQAKYVNRSVDASDVGSYVLGKFSPEEITFEENYYLKKENSKLILTSSDRTTTATCTVDINGKVEWEGTEIDDDSEEDSSSGTPALVDVSYKGYFADLNGDGMINVEDDGVIYVDLLAQSGEIDQWNNSDGAYTIPEASSANSYKSYIVSEETTLIAGMAGYGIKNMIKVVPGTAGRDRFYVMGLKNISNETISSFYWYYSAYSTNMNDYNSLNGGSPTSINFGTGKDNTTVMITKWNNTSYGTQNNLDMWGIIAEEITNGWFVPSRGEWGAFCKSFNITELNYGNYGLRYNYWSSSQDGTNKAWIAEVGDGCMYNPWVKERMWVRLSTNF